MVSNVQLNRKRRCTESIEAEDTGEDGGSRVSLNPNH